MNRQEAEAFIYRSYERAVKYQDYYARDAEKRRPDLTREIIRRRAGTPCAVVTGSKGKGSAANMISHILQSRYKVGMMTSPHLTDFCERFRVDGQRIPDDEFIRQVEGIRREIELIDDTLPKHVCISPMGIQADLGLRYFNACHTQFNVFECGKGVRYDDVNNVKHDYAVINSIFPEHTRELGKTVEEIASDKCRVIDGEQKCVYAARQKETVAEIIRERAGRWKTPVKIYGPDFRAERVRYTKGGMAFDAVIGNRTYTGITIPLLGEHQAWNCVLAMALCRDVLGELDGDDVRERLKTLKWPGRMEVLRARPFVMLDACISRASCAAVLQVLEHLGIGDITAVVGIPDDKDYAGVVREIKKAASTVILTGSQNTHYVFTPMQCEKLKEEGIDTTWCGSLGGALALAWAREKPVVILGTTSVVSEVKKMQADAGGFF